MYVDDLLLIAETMEEIQQMKRSLSNTFKRKDIGKLQYCLGVNFKWNEKGVSLCQKQYLSRLLEKFGMSEANTVSTSVDPNVKFDKHSERVDLIQYQSPVGSLLHTARATHPNTASDFKCSQNLSFQQRGDCFSP